MDPNWIYISKVYLSNDNWVEIDWMAGHRPNQLALNDVIAAFAAEGITLHLEVAADGSGTGDNIPHVQALNVWADDDTDFTNDFNSLKNIYFGKDLERTVITRSHSETIVPTTGNSAITFEIQISGISVTTPDRTIALEDKTKGEIVIKYKVVFDDEYDIAFTNFDTSGASTDFATLRMQPQITAQAATDLSDATGNTQIFTIKLPFITGQPITNFDMGQIDVTFTTKQNDMLTFATINTFETAPASPFVFTELLNAKAQVYHYFIWGHSIGPCGPSGIAEFEGNDGGVFLGCNYNVAENTAVFVDGSSNDATVGNQREQAGTFMHELGHNLALRHGGDDNSNCEPNYPSIMSYSRQTPDYLTSFWLLDFSSGDFPDLDETAVDETAGLISATENNPTIVFGTPTIPPTTTSKLGLTTRASNALMPTGINWNGLPGFQAGNQNLDINDFAIPGCQGTGTDHDDYDDWDNLVFNFRGVGGTGFDGFKAFPLTIESNERVEAAIAANLFFFSPGVPNTEEPKWGFSGKHAILFRVFSSDPANPNVESVPIENLIVQLKMLKISGDETTGEKFIPPISKKHDPTGIFEEKAPGFYKTQIDLAKLKQMFSSPAAAIGNFALYYELIDDNGTPDTPDDDIPIGIFFDDDRQFYLCEDLDQDGVRDDLCSATIFDALPDPFIDLYTLKIRLAPAGGGGGGSGSSSSSSTSDDSLGGDSCPPGKQKKGKC